MQISDVLTRNDGVCRTGDLLRAGFTRREISDAEYAGAITKVRQGVFVLDAAAHVAIAAAHGGQLACASAVAHYGIWILSAPKSVHVAMWANQHPHEHVACGCKSHQDGLTRGLGIAPLRVALVQLAKCHGRESFFAALESALHQGRLSQSDLRWVRSKLPASQAHLVDLARSDAESGLESIFRLRMFLLGVSMRSQVTIGGVGRVDFLIGNLIIEVDGRENHEGFSMRHKDLMRDAAAAARGFRVLRFNYAMILHDWSRVQSAVLAALN